MNLTNLRKKIILQLTSHSDTPQLDADLLLMHVLQKTRTQLLMDESIVEARFIASLDQLITRRINGEPIAYILGSQPFWTMDLIVTPDVLIPRAETECLIEWVLKQLFDANNYQVADLGTGSGAIAIALALEKPHWQIDATDQSAKALLIARQNAKKYNAKNISFFESDWFDALPPKKYDLIISNPPYIAQNDAHLEKLIFEPISALTSGKTGLDAIENITQQAMHYLQPNGYLVIEHGYDQAEAVFKLFEQAGFYEVKNHCDLSGIPRFVTGMKS